MWLKKTTVKTRTGIKTYLQIMETIYTDGKTKQKLIASLGNIKDINISTAKALIESLNIGLSDSLKKEQISLLKPKRYGKILLLKQIYRSIGLDRLFNDIVIHRRAGIDIIKPIFSLIAYYSINKDVKKPFYEWIEEYYIPSYEEITNTSIVNAIKFFQNGEYIKKAVVSFSNKVNEDYGNILHFIIRIIDRIDYDKNEKNVKFILISSIQKFIPHNFSMLHDPKYSSGYLGLYEFFISDNIDIMAKHHGKSHDKHNYIYILKKDNLGVLFNNIKRVKKYVENGGHFKPFGNIGYKKEVFEKKNVIVLRPTPGYVDETQFCNEPRDILVTNSTIKPDYIIQAYDYFNKLGDDFYDIYLPKDLAFLYDHFSKKYLKHFTLNILFADLLLESVLKNRLSKYNIDLEEAKNIVSDIVIAQIPFGDKIKYYHSEFNEKQMRLFELIGLDNHLEIKLD